MTASNDRWRAETVRLYRRYEDEIVKVFGLCPWAGPVRRDGRMTEKVLVHRGTSVGPSLRAIDALDKHIDVAVLIYPRVALSRPDFESFAATVRDAEVARHALGTAPFVFAVFHPDANAQLMEPERLIPFLRRTPDPTLQLLRSSVLDQVRGSTSQGTQFVDLASVATLVPRPASLRERVAKVNHETTMRVGVERIKNDLDAILRDREETHRALEAVTA